MTRRRLFQFLPGVAVAVLLVAAPLVYGNLREYHLRNFRVVQDGVLYRSSQLSPPGLDRVIHDYGIRTVVSFRYGEPAGTPPPDLWEENFCRKIGIDYVRIAMVGTDVWTEPAGGGPPPAMTALNQFQDVMADPKRYPVLAHCFRGAHRTGVHCALFRMEQQGWSNADAIAELKALGYANLEKETDVLGFLTNYRAKRSPGAGR